MSKNWELLVHNAIDFAQMDEAAFAEMYSQLSQLPLALSSSERAFEILQEFGASNDFQEEQQGPGQFALHVLYVLADRGDKSLSATVEEIISDVKRESEEQELDLSSSNSLRPQLERLASLTNVIMSIKAAILLAERQKLFTDAQVICDMRPVIGDDLSEPPGFLLLHTLKLEFAEDNKTHVLHIALDEEDIAKLITQLTRAQRKGKALAHTFRTTNFSIIE